MTRSPSSPDVSALTREQTETALRFLLHRLTLDNRLALMRTQPVTYSVLYPQVEPVTIMAKVAGAIRAARIHEG